MHRTLTAGVLALALAAVPASAQEASHADHAMHHADGAASVKPLYNQFKGWLLAAADQVPEDKYGFRPVEGVRSFGELLGHVGNASYLFCSTGSGTKNPSSADLEKATSKAAIIAGLKAAFAYCDAAYELTHEDAMKEAELFGNKGSRLWVLTFNAVHNSEHYGNIVTYMRMMGMVPPSSQ